MYICICNAVTDSQIRGAFKSGQCSTIKQLCQQYGVGTQCGKCCQDAKKIFEDVQNTAINSRGCQE
jgi:bacterioferritin-associated ferredoxin